MDLKVCKTSSIMLMCPNCRHCYNDDLHVSCPSCSRSERLNCSMPVIVPSKRHHSSLVPRGSCGPEIGPYEWTLSNHHRQYIRWPQFLNGGSVTCNKEDPLLKLVGMTKKLNHETEKSSTNGPLPPVREQSNDPPGDTGSNISPTASLSFILSPHTPVFASRVNSFKDDQAFCDSVYNSEDLSKITISRTLLKLSGWYHQDVTWKRAMGMLMHAAVGTFLLRDSSDPNFLYSLSVQTKGGPTSIRIHYKNGDFRLYAGEPMVHLMPKYPCIIKLIESYIESTRHHPLKCTLENNNPAWQKVVYKIYPKIVLEKPMYTKNYFPSLKHLSRLCVNQNLLDSSFRDVLAVPAYVRAYLNEYPYKC